MWWKLSLLAGEGLERVLLIESLMLSKSMIFLIFADLYSSLLKLLTVWSYLVIRKVSGLLISA